MPFDGDVTDHTLPRLAPGWLRALIMFGAAGVLVFAGWLVWSEGLL